MDTEELLQEVFKKIWTDAAADYDLRRWLGQLRFTRRHQRATESPCFIAATAAIRRPDPWYWPLAVELRLTGSPASARPQMETFRDPYRTMRS
jgi:hypothetical protein